MLFFTVALALLPLLAAAEISLPDPEISYAAFEVTESIPTLDEMHAAYPDISFQQVGDRLEARDANTNLSIAASTLNYRITAGGLAVLGYYSLGPGEDRVQAAIDACRPAADGDSLTCWNKVISAGIAHVLIGGAGFHAGAEFITLFFAGLAQTATALGASDKRSLFGRASSCSSNQRNFNTPYTFQGNYGLKVVAKAFCYSPSANDLSNVQSFGSVLGPGMQKNGALTTDFTIYTNDKNKAVLARYHMEAETVPTDLCPLAISGSNDCSCSGC